MVVRAAGSVLGVVMAMAVAAGGKGKGASTEVREVKVAGGVAGMALRDRWYRR